jgi:hypothetical protein
MESEEEAQLAHRILATRHPCPLPAQLPIVFALDTHGQFCCIPFHILAEDKRYRLVPCALQHVVYQLQYNRHAKDTSRVLSFEHSNQGCKARHRAATIRVTRDGVTVSGPW